MNHARAGSVRTPDLGSPVAEVALLDRDGVIVTVNDAWESFCRDNGGDAGRTGVGMSYLDVCAAAGDDDGVQEAVALVRDALAGQVMAPVSLLIPCDAPGRPRLFDMLVSSRFDDDGRCVGAAVVMVPHPLEATGTGPGPIPAQRLTFPDLPRLELERTLAQLASQSQHALAAQGRLRALLQANAEVVSALDLPIVLRKFVAAARDLVHARTAVLSVQGPEGAPDQLVHAGTREPPPRPDRRPVAGPGRADRAGPGPRAALRSPAPDHRRARRVQLRGRVAGRLAGRDRRGGHRERHPLRGLRAPATLAGGRRRGRAAALRRRPGPGAGGGAAAGEAGRRRRLRDAGLDRRPGYGRG